MRRLERAKRRTNGCVLMPAGKGAGQQSWIVRDQSVHSPTGKAQQVLRVIDRPGEQLDIAAVDFVDQPLRDQGVVRNETRRLATPSNVARPLAVQRGSPAEATNRGDGAATAPPAETKRPHSRAAGVLACSAATRASSWPVTFNSMSRYAVAPKRSSTSSRPARRCPRRSKPAYSVRATSF